MDPFMQFSSNQAFKKKDKIVFEVRAADCVTWSKYVAKSGTGKRLAWRPPRPWTVTSPGNVHDDTRGLFEKFLGAKVSFNNKLNAKLRLKGTMPLGKLEDNKKCYTRVAPFDVVMDPAGSNKDESRVVRKKGKQQVAKTYSKKTDKFVFNVRESKLFSGDANMYTLFEEKIPGDKITSPSYLADGMVLLDYIPILPNESQYTGEAFSPDLIVMEVIVVVDYMVSTTNKSNVAIDQVKVPAIVRSELGSLEAVFHVDEDNWTTTRSRGKQNVKAITNPTLFQLPYESYQSVGIGKEDDKAVLCWFNGDVQQAKVSLPSYEDPDLRICCLGLAIGEGTQTDGGYRPVAVASQFGFSQDLSGWYMMHANGDLIEYKGIQVTVQPARVSGRIPFYVYSIVRPTVKVNGAGNEINANSTLFKEIGEVLDTVVEVVTGVLSFFA